MNGLNSFWTGVGSGLLSAFLIYIFRGALGKILSILAGLFSRRIRGTWGTKFWQNSKTFEEYAEISQIFHWVWGKITYPDKGRKYHFRGTIRSNVLVAMYEVIKQSDTIDRGAFTLFLNPVGSVKKMEGKYSWTDDETQLPQADRYEWTKKS